MLKPSVLQVVNSIETAFDERRLLMQFDHVSEKRGNTALIAGIDDVLLPMLRNLSDFPAQKWLALCDALEPSAILACAVSYCQGFHVQHLEKLFEAFPMALDPLGDLCNAVQFIRLNAIHTAEGNAPRSIEDIFALGLDIKTTAVLLSAFQAMPSDSDNDFFKNINSDLATVLAYKWACHGLPPELHGVLEHWWKHADFPNPAQFWSLFALVIRNFEFQNEIDTLAILAYDEKTTGIALMTKQAICDGPLDKNAALKLVELPDVESISACMQRFIRLAVWLPRQAPLVEIGAPTIAKQQQFSALRAHVNEMIDHDVPFVPEAYRQQQAALKQSSIAGLTGKEADSQMQTRGWSQTAMEETLAQTPFQVLANTEGQSVLIRFHGETGAGIATGEDSDSQDILHFGRACYVYEAAEPENTSCQRGLNLSAPENSGCEWVLLPLKHENLRVWRPVEARQMEGNIYCIMPMQQTPQDERWLYPPTAYVICRRQAFLGGTFLAAVKHGPMRI